MECDRHSREHVGIYRPESQKSHARAESLVRAGKPHWSVSVSMVEHERGQHYFLQQIMSAKAKIRKGQTDDQYRQEVKP